jgi:hypothetical protein
MQHGGCLPRNVGARGLGSVSKPNRTELPLFAPLLPLGRHLGFGSTLSTRNEFIGANEDTRGAIKVLVHLYARRMFLIRHADVISPVAPALAR